MFKKHIINKISITAEAIFDYESIISKQIMPKKELKKELEEYIDWMNDAGKLLHTEYFRVKYYDENIRRMLYVFIYRTRRFGHMQNWRLSGLCLAKDWNENIECCGHVRTWLKSHIDLSEMSYSDWVCALRERNKFYERG